MKRTVGIVLCFAAVFSLAACNQSKITHPYEQEYKTLGCQVTSGTKEVQEQAHFVSSFFDIYENSFD